MDSLHLGDKVTISKLSHSPRARSLRPVFKGQIGIVEDLLEREGLAFVRFDTGQGALEVVGIELTALKIVSTPWWNDHLS